MAQYSASQGSECDDFTMFKKLQTVFRSLGACMVLEMSAFNAISLELAYKEFHERFTKVNGDKIQAYLQTKQELAQSSASEANAVVEESKQPAAAPGSKFYKKAQELPIIASECPGWVCYAEKRVGDLALPFMSKTKSPQQICGALSKLFLSQLAKTAGSADASVSIMRVVVSQFFLTQVR